MELGGAFLTVALERLFEKLSRSLNLQKQVLNKLQNWKSLLPKILALLEDAEEKQMSNSNKLIRIWLAEIRDLAYDMEDILDEFQVDSQRSSLNIPKLQQASTSNFIPSCFNCFKQNDLLISKVDDITLRLQRLLNESTTLRLQRLLNESTTFGLKSSGMATRWLPVTTFLPDLYVCGRQNEKAALLDKLLNDEGCSKGFSVIPIVGMVGIGKTTLARLVYNEAKVEENFEVKCWVCVSVRFDIMSITKAILEAVGGECDLNNLHLLQQELKSKLLSKKFLLVLDDIWYVKDFWWDSLQKPFLTGAAGSKIIITTHNEHVVEIMGGMDRVCRLEVLKDEECLSVFAQHALRRDNFDAHPNLKDIGEKIVRRCKGLPLLAKILGGLLCDRLNHFEWEGILNSEIWNLQESDILPALGLSYHYLPSYLKPCFVYCALFPKDHEFEKNQLVLLWMASGVLQQQSIETGHQYFDELVSRAFLERSSGTDSRFVMNDFIHDLAQFVAGESCFNLEHKFGVDKKSEVNYEKVRHLSCIRGYYDTTKKFEGLNVMKCLRTFIPMGSRTRCNLSNTVLHDWLPKLRCLRALSLESYLIAKLPDSIGDLIHLKYLNLSETLIESLPESVGFLLKLQTLLLFNCKKFFKLPVTIGNLIYLHHLDIEGTSSLKEMPSAIGNLKNLLTLSKFIVGKENKLMKLSILKNFSQLKGKLSILNLENVLNVQDAKNANLKNIDGLDELALEWTFVSCNTRKESNEEMQVLNWLMPHSNLKSLTIVSNGGPKFPSWIGDPIFSNLSYLELRDCKRCTLLPSLGLSPVLKELIIEGMEGIKAVGPEFYGNGTFSSMEKLVIRNMLNWKEWTSSIGSGGEFPCLGHLEIENCPMLTGQLPSHLSSLVSLVINGCPELRCLSTMSLVSLKNLHIGDCNVILLKSIIDLTSLTLTQLRIENISEISCLPKCFTQFLTVFKNLEIEGCKELTCLWEDGSETINLACLEKMEIRSCPSLVSLIGKEQGLLPSNLHHLAHYSYEALESLLLDLMVRKMGGSSSRLRLEELKLYDCPLRSLSLPITLKRLTLEECENLECLPEEILMQDNGDNNSNLEYLFIEKLPSLNYFQRDQLPTSLKEFEVRNCKGLESVPKGMLHQCTGLRSIQIWNCQRLKCLPSLDHLSNLIELVVIHCDALESIPDLGSCIHVLKVLKIVSCKNLKSFPNTTMSSLKLLKELIIDGCPKIELIPSSGGNENGGLLLDLPPNLVSVELDDAILKFLLPNAIQKLVAGCGFHNLTSLQHLEISCRTLQSDIELPSSLTTLSIASVQNLESIPIELLQNLNSLQKLDIWSWPKLRSLPKKGLPPSVEQLCIFNCPLLKRQRFEVEGDHWPLTHNIPYVAIDWDRVFPWDSTATFS